MWRGGHRFIQGWGEGESEPALTLACTNPYRYPHFALESNRNCHYATVTVTKVLIPTPTPTVPLPLILTHTHTSGCTTSNPLPCPPQKQETNPILGGALPTRSFFLQTRQWEGVGIFSALLSPLSRLDPFKGTGPLAPVVGGGGVGVNHERLWGFFSRCIFFGHCGEDSYFWGFFFSNCIILKFFFCLRELGGLSPAISSVSLS